MTSAPKPLVALVAALAAACGEGPAPSAEATAPAHVFLISIDTLRYDHVGFNGYEKPTTPFLDSLAERGVVFDDHYANSNCTLPSHASMLTGLLPPSHGVDITTKVGDPLRVLSPSIVTVAERFQEAGYATAAFTSHAAWLNEEYGFDQGFDHFETSWRQAPETFENFLALVDERPAERTFSFLHFFDVHSDEGQGDPRLIYEAPRELIEQFAGPIPEGFTGRSPDGARKASTWLATLKPDKPLPDAHRDFLVGTYDAGIAWFDRRLEGFFAQLDERGLLDNALVVITSDHGEAFGEHGTYLHSGWRSDTSHVPLLIVPPAGLEVTPHRVATRTQSTDLAPTLLELCLLDPVGETRSLTGAVLFEEPLEDSMALFQNNMLYGTDAEGDYLMIHNVKQPAFIDRTRDPMENVNLSADAAWMAQHQGRLQAAWETWKEIVDQGKANFELIKAGATTDAALDPEREAELKRLGYL